LASRRGLIFLVGTTSNNLERVILQWPLQRFRFVPRRAHPHVAFLTEASIPLDCVRRPRDTPIWPVTTPTWSPLLSIMFMIDLLSREASRQRLRLLGDDSETNRALGYFPFAFGPSSTSLSTDRAMTFIGEHRDFILHLDEAHFDQGP